MLRYEMVGKKFKASDDTGTPILDDEGKEVEVEVTEEMLTSLQMREYIAAEAKIYDREAWDALKKRKRSGVDMWDETLAEAKNIFETDLADFDDRTVEEDLEEDCGYKTYDPDTFVLPAPLKQEEQKGGAPA